MDDEHDPIVENEAGTEVAKVGKKPIRLKDAIGRMYTFPFDMARTWGVCLSYLS